MCGIAGVFSYGGGAADIDELTSIRDSMLSRGPDGCGIWRREDNRVGLAHRRLSIIDTSEAGAQPMRHPATGNQIVFNGEIYNFRELRRKLEVEGATFRSNSDTEVLLHLYAAHGEQMLHRLRGMYAFAIWDERAASLFLARDPFGIKPLYYADDGTTFRFASQVRALLRGNVDRQPEPAGHAGFFLWGSVPEPFTLYRGIRTLPAGSYLRIGERGALPLVTHSSVTSTLAGASTGLSPTEIESAVAEASAAVADSVAAHLVADVPVGVFLSSGLDSNMVAGAAAAHGDLRTITLGFEEFAGTDDDEVPLAEETARQLAATHTTVRVTKANFQQDLQHLLAAMDQPSIDGVNSWFVAKAAASRGLKVALSGLGGDELFAAYPSFRDVPRIASLVSPFARVPWLGSTFRVLSAPLLRRFTSPKYGGLFEYGGSLGSAYLLRRGLFMPWELADVLDPDLAREGWRALETRTRLEGTVDGIGSARLAVTALESCWYMRHQLLRDADWAGMAHSVEIRVPLADIELLRRVAPVFAAVPKLAKRQIAAAVAPQLPLAVLNRPKSGFSIPVRTWLTGGSGPSERGMRRWARRVYADATGAA